MKPVPLDPGDYTGTYKLVGGELSLDFVNTVSWPGEERAHDWFDRGENVTRWAAAVGIIGARARKMIDARPRVRTVKELSEVRRIRDDLRSVLWPLARGEWPPPSAIDALNRRLAAACSSRYIDRRTGRWAWKRPASLSDVLAPVVWNAAHVLTELDRERLRYCPACDWLFYDTTRSANRRWCDMLDCGSRDKALRYYHRSKGDLA